MVKLYGGQRPGFWFEISDRRQFLVTFRTKKGVNVAEGWQVHLQIDWEWNS